MAHRVVGLVRGAALHLRLPSVGVVGASIAPRPGEIGYGVGAKRPMSTA